MIKTSIIAVVLLSSIFPYLAGNIAYSAEVNVYSARKEALIKPVLDKFSEQTGIKVNLITGKADGLVTRMASEGKFSPADILLTTDAGRLVRAKQQGLTQPIKSEKVNNLVASGLRDQEDHWFALTLRARPIMMTNSYTGIVPETYEDLTSSQYKGSICIRSSSNIYNQSMIAALIEQTNEQTALQFSKGIVKNLARPPKGGDRDQIRALVAGQCKIAIANTYYLAGMLTGNDQKDKKIAQQVKVVWPNQQGRGTHVNISGAALAKHAPNQAEARQLLEFMLDEQSQIWYAETNNEYPVREGVAWSDVLQKFGQFKAEKIALERVGELNAQAVKVMDRAGWK